ncbi:MAG: type II toxin-antitoxin system HicA family toxin [Legionella sp.]
MPLPPEKRSFIFLDIVLFFGTIINMKAKHRNTLEKIFETPVNSSIVWKDVEALFVTLGGDISEGRGSRVRVALNDVRAVFHRPHPKKETDKGAVISVRRFLKEAGVEPC